MSSMVKLPENAPLAVLLFSAVYQGVSFTFVGHIMIGGLFILSSCSYMFMLAFRQKQNSYSIISALIFSWLIFILSYLYADQKILPLEWLYVLSICSYLMMALTLANILNISGWVLVIYSRHSEININALEALIYAAIFMFLLNVMVMQATSLRGKIKKEQTSDATTGGLRPHQLKQEMSKTSDLCQRYSIRASNVLLRFDQNQELLTTLGQQCYENFLGELAQVCKSRLRTTDILCRYNDESFIILLPNTGEESACYLAEDLLMACEAYNYSFIAQVHSSPPELKASLKFSYQTSEYDANESWEAWFHHTVK